MLRIKACGLSDVGLTRVHNEDYFQIDPRHRLYVVADGMGGHSAGEVAAQIAVKAIHDFIEQSVDRDASTWSLRKPYFQPRPPAEPASAASRQAPTLEMASPGPPGAAAAARPQGAAGAPGANVAAAGESATAAGAGATAAGPSAAAGTSAAAGSAAPAAVRTGPESHSAPAVAPLTVAQSHPAAQAAGAGAASATAGATAGAAPAQAGGAASTAPVGAASAAAAAAPAPAQRTSPAPQGQHGAQTPQAAPAPQLEERLARHSRLLKMAVRTAHDHVLMAISKDGSLHGMGTTVVGVLVAGPTAAVAHVGDSRAYRLRNGRLDQLTQDHTWVHEQVVAGLLSQEQARSHPLKNVVTRALGGESEVVVDVREVQVEAGDLFLLCSDGLTGMLSDSEIRDRLGSGRSLHEICRTLVNEANARGGLDNVTVVLLSVEEADEDEAGGAGGSGEIQSCG